MNALASPEVGKFVTENFCSSYQKVATFKIVGGAKQGGNVATYFCAPDGRVLHVIAGPVDAPTGAEGRLVVGQIVLTATSLPEVRAVRLAREGEPVDAPLPDGELTSAPLIAEQFASFLIPAPPPTATPAPRSATSPPPPTAVPASPPTAAPTS